ncbi:hypothetical protein PI124_g10240 [Phytophthora idaei]|nr:hypothetical protein PI125_g17333 [Phytophthora idaei]KAG3245005.1 hypothetical protein PI124_g10240 [Phytophthora idaei]
MATYRRNQLDGRFQDDTEAATKEWKRIWHIMASVCQTKLWVDRNEAVFRDKKISLQECAAQLVLANYGRWPNVNIEKQTPRSEVQRCLHVLSCSFKTPEDPRHYRRSATGNTGAHILG